MIAIPTRRFFGLLIVILICATAANIAVSQVPTVNGAKAKVKTYRELVLTVAAGQTTPISHASWTGGLVPAGRVFVVTDVIISNIGTTTMLNAKVIRDGDNTNAPAFTIPGETTFAHSFTTGLQYEAGSAITCRNPGSSGAIFTLTGYEAK